MGEEGEISPSSWSTVVSREPLLSDNGFFTEEKIKN
jgi:hypothetical protein